MCLTTSELVQIGSLIVLAFYTVVTYKLLTSQNRQSFENQFFQLLNLHHGIVNAIERYVGNLPVHGRRNFEVFNSEFLASFQKEYAKNHLAEQGAIISAAYRTFFPTRQPEIGHYFRNLYHIIKFIDDSKSKKKEYFVHLVRAQLSSQELLLLFYNCLGPYGIEKFKPLVERYSLLENMPEDEIISKKLNLPLDHKTLYDPHAFQK